MSTGEANETDNLWGPGLHWHRASGIFAPCTRGPPKGVVLGRPAGFKCSNVFKSYYYYYYYYYYYSCCYYYYNNNSYYYYYYYYSCCY